MPDRGSAVEAAVAGELRLLDPRVRSSPDLVGALLHPEFHEFGASGRHWDRASIIAALAGAADESADPIVPSAMKGVELAPDLVHLTFDTTDHNGTRAHRSSPWRLTPNGWLLYFHQATPYGATVAALSLATGFASAGQAQAAASYSRTVHFTHGRSKGKREQVQKCNGGGAQAWRMDFDKCHGTVVAKPHPGLDTRKQQGQQRPDSPVQVGDKPVSGSPSKQ